MNDKIMLIASATANSFGAALSATAENEIVQWTTAAITVFSVLATAVYYIVKTILKMKEIFKDGKITKEEEEEFHKILDEALQSLDNEKKGEKEDER